MFLLIYRPIVFKLFKKMPNRQQVYGYSNVFIFYLILFYLAEIMLENAKVNKLV